MSKKKISIIAIIVILLILIGLGFNSVFSNIKKKEETNKKNISSEILVSEVESLKNKENSHKQLSDDKLVEIEEEKKIDIKEEKEENTSKKDGDTSSNKNEINNTNGSNNNSNGSTSESRPQTIPSTPIPVKNTVTVSISCKTAINNNLHNEPGFTHLPASGIILSNTTIEISEGDTVFDVLVKATRNKGIHMEYTGSASSIYIEGINNLYEFDGGNGSGWMYSVNGVYPNYGCGAYKLKANDVIRWNYTCNLGADLGASRN